MTSVKQEKENDLNELDKDSNCQSQHLDNESSDSSHELMSKVANWWQLEKTKIASGEMLKFLQDNKDRFEKTLSSIHQNSFFYRLTNRLFALVAFFAGWVDRVKDFILAVF